MFANFRELRDNMAATPNTLVAAAAHDKHTLEAVFAAAQELPMRYILVGDRENIISLSSEIGFAPGTDTIVDAKDAADCASKAVALIREGKGDVLMKGALESGILLKAVLDKDAGIKVSGTMSHAAILEVPGYHKLITVTDGGMLPSPTLEQKADIVRNTVAFYNRLGFRQPKIAALCASESVNERIQETVDAAHLQSMCQKGELGGCLLEGPLSFDLAVSRESALTKGFSSDICGDADVLLVPNITVGNVLCKGLIYWGNTIMAGCVLGAKVPIVLVSRNATAEEKLFSIMLCLYTSGGIV